MGKRELIIVTAFVAAGIVAYQLAAAPEGGRRGFSLSSFLDEVRREGRDRRSTASVTTEGTIEAPSTVADLRISNVAHLTIQGEARENIQYRLTVESGGADEGAARASAGRTTLREDRLGPVLALRANEPEGARHVATLALVVPDRLRVRIEGTTGGATLLASRLAAVELENMVGDVRLIDVAGPVTGSHRNGDLVATRARTIDLTLVGSQATLEASRDNVRLTVRNGRCQVIDPVGLVEVAATNTEVSVLRPAADVRLTGSGGRVTVDAPRAELYIDMRRSAVEVVTAHTAPVTALTTDAPLSVRVTGAPSLLVDALTTDGGSISGEGFSLATETAGGDTRARHTFGEGRAPVSLRNRRAPIVIDATK